MIRAGNDNAMIMLEDAEDNSNMVRELQIKEHRDYGIVK